MGQMQTNLQATRASEIKAKASEESLQKEIVSLKEKLVASNSSDAASTTTLKPGQLASSATNETGSGDTDTASQPTEGEGSNEIQLADGTKTKAGDPNLQSASAAESMESVSDSANVVVTAIAAPVDQKKGRKRKANAPKKNVALGSDVEIVDVDAPPLKKPAAPAVVINDPVVGAEPLVESTVVPTQKKVVPKKVGAKKVVSSTASMDVASENQSVEAAESTKLPMSKKFTKKSLVASKDISSSLSNVSVAGGVAEDPVPTAESKKEEEMRMKLEL